MQELAPGTKLNNRYRILRTLGQGGFAFTYEAIQEPIHLRVCIKELSASGLKEGEVLASIKSPNVVRVLDYFEENRHCYIVLEYLEGQTLLEYVRERGCISPGVLFTAARQLLGALSEIHNLGLIHRDIAPDNIMVLSEKSEKGTGKESGQEPGREPGRELGQEPGVLRLKLFDFGTARPAGLSQYTCTLKDGYTPIEQLASDGEQGAFTDLYALSAVLYFCLTTKKPEGAYSRLLDDDLKMPSQLGIPIEGELEKILEKGLSLQPNDRYQSAQEMLEDIERALPGREKKGEFSEEGTGRVGKTDEAGKTDKAGKTGRAEKTGKTGKTGRAEKTGKTGKIDKADRINKKAQGNKRRILPGICAAAVVCMVFVAFFVWHTGRRSPKYDPESMYKITLTPTDEFTVAGYNESIEILKERLKIFSRTSGSYSLQEKGGVITLFLNKEDFPQNGEEDENYKSTTYAYEAIPEYVLRAYLSRAAALTLKQTGGDETIPLEQMQDFSVREEEDGLELGLSAAKYLSIDFKEDFIQSNKALLESWNNAYSLVQDSDCSPPVIPFAIFPKEDGKGFYLLTDDESDTLFEVLQYNLTHAPLEHSFTIALEEQTDWQKKGEEFGAAQTEEARLSPDSVSYYIYGSMSEGEKLDCWKVLRNRLDALGSSYALGQMDSLSAVTAGCDAPIYTFLGIKGQDRLQYTDIADLALCSNQFLICTSEGQYSDDITSCFLEEEGIKIHADAFAQTLSDEGEKVYLMAVRGYYDQTPLMEGELLEDGAFCFPAFASGAGMEEYPWVAELIAACIENQAPVTLSSYSVKADEDAASKLSELGLFQTRESQ